ncbi:hypothetical protein BH11PSE7_BH11PSE7_35730 [soil metagenome]
MRQFVAQSFDQICLVKTVANGYDWRRLLKVTHTVDAGIARPLDVRDKGQVERDVSMNLPEDLKNFSKDA